MSGPSTFIRGGHLPNQGVPSNSPAYPFLATMRANGALLMPYHSNGTMHDVRAAIGADAYFVARLPESEFENPTNKQHYVPSWQDYANACLDTINRLHIYGVNDFVIDNEPQQLRVWGPERAWEWANFMHDVLQNLKPALHKDIRIGLTPFTDQNLQTWLRAVDHNNLASFCDFMAVHSYWQAPGDRTSPQFGGNCQVFHRWHPELPIMITEWGSSVCQTRPPPSPEEVQLHMRVEYPDWLNWIHKNFSYVEGTYLFILPGATDEWAGFMPDLRVALALKPGV
jgi:hypothetical protein